MVKMGCSDGSNLLLYCGNFFFFVVVVGDAMVFFFW